MTAVNLNRAIRGPVTAVPVVAGNGVRLVADTVNNRFVVEADETVLYDCSNNYVYGTNSATLSESYKNFELIKILDSKGGVTFYYPANAQTVSSVGLSRIYSPYVFSIPWEFTSDTIFTGTTGKLWEIGKSTVTDVPNNSPYGRWIQPIKIVGVNRIASN